MSFSSQWRDITIPFREACSKLPEEKLVSASHFNLFDCISAIPVGDKIMDTGIEIPLAKERGKWTLQDISNDSFSLGLQELLNILDLLLLSNMDWMCGQLLIHTFFSSVFFVNYKSTPSPLIKTFISVLARSMSLTRIFILSAGVYYDEDFYSDTRGMLIEPNDGIQDPEQAFKSAKSICDYLEQCLKSPALLKSSLQSLDPSISLAPYSQEELTSLTKQLLSRFIFVCHYYRLWSDLSNHSVLPAQDALISSTTDIIETCQKTLSLTSHPAFDLTIHRKLYSQTPATPKFLSVSHGFGLYSTFIRHLTAISALFEHAKESVGSSNGDQDTLSVLLFELESFWMDEKEMLIPTRSYLQNCIYSLIKQDDPFQILPSIKSHSPASGKLHPLANPSKLYTDILQECQTLFFHSLKLACLNRSRQRRQLYHLALSFAQLSKHLVSLEPQLQPDALFLCTPPRPFEFILMKWSNIQFLTLAARYFALGFELNMYAPYEMAQAYLVLEFIYSELVALASDTTLSPAVDDLKVDALDLTEHARFVVFNLSEFVEFYRLQAQLSRVSFKICRYAAKTSNASHLLPPKPFFNPSIHFKNRFTKLVSRYASSFTTMMHASQSNVPWNGLEEWVNSQMATFDALCQDDLVKECSDSALNCKLGLESFLSKSPMSPFKKMSDKCLKVCTTNLAHFLQLESSNPPQIATMEFAQHPQFGNLLL